MFEFMELTDKVWNELLIAQREATVNASRAMMCLFNNDVDGYDRYTKTSISFLAEAEHAKKRYAALLDSTGYDRDRIEADARFHMKKADAVAAKCGEAALALAKKHCEEVKGAFRRSTPGSDFSAEDLLAFRNDPTPKASGGYFHDTSKLRSIDAVINSGRPVQITGVDLAMGHDQTCLCTER